jgi:hypothetical protein
MTRARVNSSIQFLLYPIDFTQKVKQYYYRQTIQSPQINIGRSLRLTGLGGQPRVPDCSEKATAAGSGESHRDDWSLESGLREPCTSAK